MGTKALRLARFLVLFVGLSFAPIFPRATLVRSQEVAHRGDVVESAYTFDSLRGMYTNLRYARPEERDDPYLAIDTLGCAALAGLASRWLGRWMG